MTANQVLLGDCLDILPTLLESSVQCCVTSPPYWGLRDYGTRRWYGGDAACEHDRDIQHKPLHPGQVEQSKAPKRQDYSGAGQGGNATTESCSKCRAWYGQIGLEPDPRQFVQHIVEIFREVRRVLRDDGVLFLNMGDTYKGTGADAPHVKKKDLLGMPWECALALRADGWYLRSEIIWHKQVALPESVKDRPTRNHEHIFLLTKSERYFYDNDAIKELAEDGYRNRRTVWSFGTSQAADGHFAAFPDALPALCIKAGTREGDFVLDPFAGSGTTLVVASELGRRYLGCEISPEYKRIATDRTERANERRRQQGAVRQMTEMPEASLDDLRAPVRRCSEAKSGGV